MKLDSLRLKASDVGQQAFTILVLDALTPHMTPAGTAVVLGMYPMPLHTVADKLALDQTIVEAWLAERRAQLVKQLQR